MRNQFRPYYGSQANDRRERNSLKNILRFLKGTQKTVLVIVLLLVIQAYCDLSLPSYTSDILNVGLQQNGIIHVSPETVRDSSIKDLGLFMPDEEYERIEAAYGEPDSDGVRSLNEDADLEETDRILMLPEAVLFQMQMSDSYVASEYKAQGRDLTKIPELQLKSTF